MSQPSEPVQSESTIVIEPNVSVVDTCVRSSLLNQTNTWKIPKGTSPGRTIDRDRSEEPVFITVPQKGNRNKQQDYKRELKELCLRDKIYDPITFRKRMRRDKEYEALYKKMHNNMWDKNLKNACSYARELPPIVTGKHSSFSSLL